LWPITYEERGRGEQTVTWRFHRRIEGVEKRFSLPLDLFVLSLPKGNPEAGGTANRGAA
jgi:hypothetical protein